MYRLRTGRSGSLLFCAEHARWAEAPQKVTKRVASHQRLSIAPCLGVLTIVVDGRKLCSTEAGRVALVGQGVVLGPEADHERAGGCGMCCGRFLTDGLKSNSIC